MGTANRSKAFHDVCFKNLKNAGFEDRILWMKAAAAKYPYIDNAHRLRGRLFLIVGEMDTNVPPESTMRFADALIKAGKDFDLLVVPGADHGARGPATTYVQRRMNDFFVSHLLGVEPPERNAGSAGGA